MMRNATFGPSGERPLDGQRSERSENGQKENRWSRRQFVRLSGLAVGATGLAVPTNGIAVGVAEAANEQASPNRKPDAVLAELMEGNRRFVKGELTHPGRRPEDFAPLAEGQAPLAIIVGCADSRVSPELVFDQGVGDLFVVRVAGNVVSGAGASVKGTIEFAVAELGARLIMVLGHSACGAVKAAVAHIDANDVLPGSIRELVDLIRPAAASVRGKPGDKLENAIRANIAQGVERLKGLDPILSGLAKSGELKVVGATYDLRTGMVEVFC
jgi:carbonic anhydrase